MAIGILRRKVAKLIVGILGQRTVATTALINPLPQTTQKPRQPMDFQRW
jgi:hypothetical protein